MPNLESYIQLGATFLILMIVLVGIYKIALILGNKAIKTYEKNLELQRDADDLKNLKFLESVGEISKVIKTGDEDHKSAHRILGEKIDKNHNEIIGIIKQ